MGGGGALCKNTCTFLLLVVLNVWIFLPLHPILFLGGNKKHTMYLPWSYLNCVYEDIFLYLSNVLMPIHELF